MSDLSTLTFTQSLRRLWALEKFSYSLRVFVALSTTMGICWFFNQFDLVIPLFLGITASALSETDDSWRGRLQALLVTLICFGIAAIAVEILFPYPLLFALGLAGSAFALVMLGALGERYATIASATLILSIYSMITVDQRGGESPDFWHEPILLVLGAAWYGALSVIWSALFVHQPVEQALARVYRELGRYFRLKASLFEPRYPMNMEARSLDLARQSAQVVAAMNAAREILLHRLHQARSDRVINHYLRLYFLAQDLHERVSSSHYPYQALTKAFFHSDVLFRCHRLIKLQSKACFGLASAILMREPFRYSSENPQAMDELRTSLAFLRQQEHPEWRGLLRSLQALANNLERVQDKLAHANNPETQDLPSDYTLLNHQPQSLSQAWERLVAQVTPTSLLFRHALRMTVALVCGYVMLHAIHPEQGYWILLTTVFVCQPNYGATRTKLVQRILGTLIGLIAGWILFTLFPAQQTQVLFAVGAGVIFFSTRGSHYTLATAAITLLVLLCFNQVGNGYALILPRLFDTLLGCLIAVGAVFLILPDWQGRRLNQMAANVLSNNSAYLQQIMDQYRSGQRDDLAYRLARRNAHNAESALSSTLSNMLLEPEPFCRDAEAGLRFLSNSHTLLNYLSGLGAHRQSLPEQTDDELLNEAKQHLTQGLEVLAQALRQHQNPGELALNEEALAIRLELAADSAKEDLSRLLYGQLALIARQLKALQETATPLSQRPLEHQTLSPSH